MKQARRTATSNPVGTNGGMSDDNKIRLQLALDVEYFGEQVSYEKRVQWFWKESGRGKGTLTQILVLKALLVWVWGLRFCFMFSHLYKGDYLRPW